MTFPYEIHITIEQCEIDHFKRYCHDAGMKPLLIDLQKSGQSIGKQLMCSYRTSTDEYRHVVAAALHAVKFFAEKDLNVQRVKIETSAVNTQLALFGSAYYECHVPVRIRTASDLENIQAFLFSEWHVSRNAFKKFDDYAVYFLTYRSVQKANMIKSLHELKTHLANLLVEVHEDKIETECVLLDTNESLDYEWLGSYQ